MILDEAWIRSSAGRKTRGYPEAREYLRLVEEEGYYLVTFPMFFLDDLHDANGIGPARITGFGKELSPKSLPRVGPRWYASDVDFMSPISEEVMHGDLLIEGASKTISMNAYERNRLARSICLQLANERGSGWSVERDCYYYRTPKTLPERW